MHESQAALICFVCVTNELARVQTWSETPVTIGGMRSWLVECYTPRMTQNQSGCGLLLRDSGS